MLALGLLYSWFMIGALYMLYICFTYALYMLYICVVPRDRCFMGCFVSRCQLSDKKHKAYLKRLTETVVYRYFFLFPYSFLFKVLPKTLDLRYKVFGITS